jgi:hypothetical protein
MYIVNTNDNKPINLSKVAYVELLDREQKPVLQEKIAVDRGTGDGSVYLPLSLGSGIYRLRAYTSWMKNFNADYFFEKPVTIVNPQKGLTVYTPPLRNYDIQFFPEGGELVKGMQSRVAFRIVDQAGRGLNCRGIVVSNTGDTITAFQSLTFGMGSFSFKPEQGNVYKAIIQSEDTTIETQLPDALNEGYVLKVNSVDNSKLEISVSTNVRSAGMIYVFIHSRLVPDISREVELTNGVAKWIVDKSNLGPGISQITIFNSAKQPVCERLFFQKPSQRLIIQPAIKEQQFSSRKKVEITINSMDELKKPVVANMSVSIFRLDSLQKMESGNIENYFWLTSDLKGNIESPEYYFSENNPDLNEATDNLMLTHGWRKFNWQDILQHSKPVYSFIPEYRGHIICGKITNKRTGKPVPDMLAYLSVPGSRVQLYVSKSDSTGQVYFYTKDFYGPNEIILQTEGGKDADYNLEIISPFADKFSSKELPYLSLSPDMHDLLTDHSTSTQVLNHFDGEKLKRFVSPVNDSAAFYGGADISYLLDNYTRFSTMEEVLREYVHEVLVRRQKDDYRFIVADVDNKLFLDNPLTLLDGVPVFDPNKIIKYDPLKVQKIDIIKRKYFYGPLISNGIVNFITYQADTSASPDLYPAGLEYDGLQYQREFFSPVYETQDEFSSRLPDFRNVLYWSPNIQTTSLGKTEISFYTSDIKGQYIAIIQGMDSDGRFGENSVSFEVK